MVNPKDIVTNLKLSKELERLGVKQESIFWWLIKSDVRQPPILVTKWFKEEHKDIGEYISAFTSTELGEKLKLARCLKWDNCSHYPIWLPKKQRWCFIDGELNFIFVKTEPNARAKMFIYLIKNGLIKLKGGK